MNEKPSAAADLLPDYKLTIPPHLQYLLAVGLGSGILGLVLTVLLPAAPWLLAAFLLLIGVLAGVLVALLLLVTSPHVRCMARGRMLAAVAWRGDEVVLDVGCGNGFLLVEAAKQLTTGQAIGIDRWQEDAGGQNAETVLRNARIEGVGDKVAVRTGDARQLPFANETFDVIVSSLALHHMGGSPDRQQALHEMVRVLKPGGQILFYDFLPLIGQAAQLLRQAGLSPVKKLGGLVLSILSASKSLGPAGGTNAPGR